MVRRRPAPEPGEADLESIEIELLLQGIYRRYGYDLRGHDAAFVARRVARRVAEEGVETVSRLLEKLLRDSALFDRFIAELSRDDASLFSPTAFWKPFRKKVAPFLRTYPTLRLWSVEGSPAEIYSLSILVEEDVPRNVRIYATEIHEGLVERAASGVLDTGALKSGARDYKESGGRRGLSTFFDRDNGAAVLSPALRRKIVFATHNLSMDGPFQSFHAILARGVLSAFDDPLRERSYRFLHESLVPLGFLALGPGDDLRRSPVAARYREVDRTARLYQKMRD
ncbi:MAG TPA: CheR family methyltransferase [Planctomycetota bacterium]